MHQNLDQNSRFMGVLEMNWIKEKDKSNTIQYSKESMRK